MQILTSILTLVSLLTSLVGNLSQNLTKEVPISRAAAQIEEQKPPFANIKARALYIADAKTSEPILSYNAQKNWPIASLTKVMTAVVLMEQNPNLNKMIALEAEDFVGGTQLKFPAGTGFSARDLLHAMLMSSANNAAAALARSGTDLTYAQFLAKMNDKARELGLKNTRFADTSGLNPENQSTPEEYAKIISYATENKTIREVMQTTYYAAQPNGRGSLALGNTNRLLLAPQKFEVIGGKNGNTYGSDYNVATKVKKGDKELVVVVFGDETNNIAYQHSKELIDKALDGTLPIDKSSE